LLIAPAASAEKLGDVGTISISGAVTAQNSKHSSTAGDAEATMIGGAAMIDRFFLPNVSVGVGVGGSYWFNGQQPGSNDPSVRAKGINGSLRLGYFIPLGERAAFWPVARVGVSGDWTTPSGRSTHHGRTIDTGLDVQLTYAISDHLYLRATPGGLQARFYRHDGGNSRQVSAGFNNMMFFGVGGWF
jgi:hypothetical protein